jgi:type IV secretory pathway TrbD component
METSAIAGWSEFLVAAAGAVGALAGLLFVSLSINLARIIEAPGISGRAAETIILLAGTLAGILVLLMPHLSPAHLGMALATVAVPTWFIPMAIQFRVLRERKYYRRSYEVSRVVLYQVAALPGVLACVALGGFIPGGIAWFAVGVILSMLVAVLNAWVLLVEILR